MELPVRLRNLSTRESGRHNPYARRPQPRSAHFPMT